MFSPAALFRATVLASLVVAGPALAQQSLVRDQSDITFVTKLMGSAVDGRFQKFDAKVVFDPKNLAGSEVAFTVDLTSASLGTTETEAELAKPDWLHLKQFPQATFQSSAIQSAAAGAYEVAGKLQIKGRTQDVVVPLKLVQANGNTTATGAFTLKRLDFNIGDGEWKDTSMVANEVQVNLKLTLSGVPAL